MTIVAVIGAGALGGTLAHTLAARSRVDEVRLIDPEGRVAAGKALDIQQSSPVEQWSTRVSAAEHIEAAMAYAAELAREESLLPLTEL